MYAVDRQAMRAVFYRAWQHYRSKQNLEGVERLIVAVALQHPEYHALLDHPPHSETRDYSAALGETNPFLHLGMHVAIEEQLSIDQPQGVRERYQTLVSSEGDEHRAQHRMMDCLAEMIWQAERNRQPPDAQAYLDCLARLRA